MARTGRINPSIKKDGIHPAAYMKYKLPWACEDCVYFDSEKEKCILGYITEPHRRAHQRASYERSGKVALCRFLELE
jgi:hypothetical protein